jgi:membrane protein
LDDSQNAGLEQQCQEVLKRPGAFAFAVIKHFRANQGLLLAGAVAYYTLLSLIPLLILILMVLSNIFEEDRLLLMLREYLEFVVPGQSNALVEELRNFLLHRELGRFSARGDALLQCPGVYGSGERHVGDFLSPRRDQAAALPRVCSDAVSVHPLSGHRRAHRHFGVRRASTRNIMIFGQAHSLDQLSALLLYIVGVTGEALLLTAIYLVMPAGRISFHHALIGGVTAAVLWEITRHILVWYYTTMSQIQVVYGSLATSIAVLLSVEIGALVLLLGA